MMYHLTGALSAALFLLTIRGLLAQLGLVWKRKQRLDAGESSERPTDILSINQFVSSFLAFFVFFLYGLCLDPIEHYLVWPRLGASLLTLVVLGEIVRDRRDRASTWAFVLCSLVLIGLPMLLFTIPGAKAWGKSVSQTLIVVVTVILAQGYLHQVWIIRRTGETGGVSSQLHLYFLWKDLATVAFGLAMGKAGWPIIFLSTISTLTKIIILWHFRWVRINPEAKRRREALRGASLVE